MTHRMTGAKMSGDKMTNGMTKRFRFNSRGKLTDGINLTDRINLTDDYKTSLREKLLKQRQRPLPCSLCSLADASPVSQSVSQPQSGHAGLTK